MNQGLRQKDLVYSAPPGTAALSGAAVNAGIILEPSDHDPRQPRRADPLAAAPHTQVIDRANALTGRSALPRPAPGQGLRLLPLSGFFWGGPMRGRFGPGPTAPTPRVRGDHVILLVREGSVAIEFPGLRHTLGKGQLACIPVGTAFALRPPALVSGWALLIPTALATNLPVSLPHEFRMGAPDQADLALLEPILGALGQGHAQDAGAQDATSCHLGLLAVALSRLHDHGDIPARPDHAAIEARPLTERFLVRAAAQLSENHTVSEFARDLGCTLAELDEACRQSRGRSALDLVYVLRLERAVDLLRNGTMPIVQIADELGYSGLGHFMRTFAAATGRSPQAFRDCVQNGAEAE